MRRVYNQLLVAFGASNIDIDEPIATGSGQWIGSCN